jgi:hypothetical protein
MATLAEIAQVREKINEPTEAVFTDARLEAIIDAAGSLDVAAAEIWRVKAARYADLVDIQEGSSRRSLGDLYEQALSMATQFDSLSPSPTSGMRPARTRPIVRP